MREIISSAKYLAENEVPDCCWSDDQENQTGHWSGTKDEMELALGRELTSSEISCLSLTRCFGPTPGLIGQELEKTFRLLWPEGNPSGHWRSWEELFEDLQNL